MSKSHRRHRTPASTKRASTQQARASQSRPRSASPHANTSGSRQQHGARRPRSPIDHDTDRRYEFERTREPRPTNGNTRQSPSRSPPRHFTPEAPSREEEDEIMDDPDANEEDTVSKAVREQYDELMAELEASEEGRWKFEDAGNSPLHHINKLARFAMRMNGPYLATGQAVTLGLTICAAPSMEEACRRSLALRGCPSVDRDRFVKVGKWLLEGAPFLEPMLPLFEERPLDLQLLGSFVDYHGRQARTADISTLKANIHKWIPEVRLPVLNDADAPPVIISPRKNGIFNKKRAEWGWNSTWSARLLVWRKHRDDFDRNPEIFLDKVRNGQIRMNEKGFPSFVYNESATANELAPGLFFGDILKQGYRCVWTSPESSTNEPGVPGPGRPSISRANGITTVIPENIAYIACLLRHILSSEHSWNLQDPKAFNGAVFFDKIVDTFTLEAIRKPVLEFYHYHVYGTVPGADVSQDDEEDDFAALRREVTGRGGNGLEPTDA